MQFSKYGCGWWLATMECWFERYLLICPCWKEKTMTKEVAIMSLKPSNRLAVIDRWRCVTKFAKSTRWAATSYKWGYNSCKWPYKWVTGVITLLTGVITPFTTGRGPPCTKAFKSFTFIIHLIFQYQAFIQRGGCFCGSRYQHLQRSRSFNTLEPMAKTNLKFKGFKSPEITGKHGIRSQKLTCLIGSKRPVFPKKMHLF